MLTENLEDVKRRADALTEGVKSTVEVIEGESEVGGGSFPGAKLKTWLVSVSDERLAARLRANDPPIIARVANGRTLLDPRTILPHQIDAVIRALND
jgi:L-seryl-tRNA(Ser) seleniumtransferase